MRKAQALPRHYSCRSSSFRRERRYILQTTPTNLQVSARTSTRREELIEITRLYTDGHPEVSCVTQSGEMDAGQWQGLLLESRFTLSPGGHNAETYRMWEALEAG